MAIGWTKARFIVRSMYCLDKLDCVLRGSVVARACTIFVTVLQLRLCFAGIENGEDPERRLPVLSTYLGHAHVTDTYWYLTGTPELLGAAGKRLEKKRDG